MPATFEDLYTDFVISSFDKQMRLADVHGEDDWGFDMTDGEITFNNAVSYKIQLLGTEDHANETWMWGWGNKASNIPEELLVVGEQLRAYGEEHGIAKLTNAMWSMEEVDGHTVGLIACGFANGKAYYRCPYDNGALFVLITDDKLALPIENDVIRATRIIPECIMALGFGDHGRAIAAYLRQSGFDVAEEAGKQIVQRDGELVLTVELDELNRLQKLKSNLKP